MKPHKLCWIVFASTVLAWAAAGTLSVQIHEYDVPTPKSRPHDPALAPDGSLWYTGQGANKLGRLDPKTGAFKEYPLKTPNSGPHGLVADRDGNIWFTAISGGYVGKLNAKSEEITEYRPDDGKEIDPHTPVIDHEGVVWFTNEETNYVGRLDPKNGKISLIKVPTEHAVPYGIVILKNGSPFFCEFGSNKLAAVNPKTMTIHEYTLPHAGGASAAAGAGAGWHGLLHGLCARLPRAFRSGCREIAEGVGKSGRGGVRAIRNRRHSRWHGVVQRIGREPQYAGAVRSKVRELQQRDDSVGRRDRA
jgi:streptogramin lyase